MSWLSENVLNPLKDSAVQLGQDALSGAITGIVGSVAAANPDNVSRDNLVVGQTPTGAAVVAVEDATVGVPSASSGTVFGYPTWAVVLGGASVLLLAVAGTAYLVKN